MYRIPYNICQKAYSILVIFLCLNYNFTVFIMPFFASERPSDSPVHDFPPSLYVVMVINFQQVLMQSLHQIDSKHTVISHMKVRHHIHLLNFIRIFLCPCIIFSGCIICSINFCVKLFYLLRHIRTVTVSYGIRSPKLHNLFCLFNYIYICRYCYSPLQY